MIHTREAESQDFSTICELMKNELGYPALIEAEAIKRLSYFDKSDDWATFVAVVDNEIVGFIGVMKGKAYNIEGHYSQIMALAVSEKAQRNGIGTALMRKAEEWSLSHGITDIGVNSNIKRFAAHAFYEKNGYVKSSYSLKKTCRRM